MENLTSLLVGIVSSLLATAIFLAAAEAFRRIVLPWWADHIYRGVRLDGTWELSDYSDESDKKKEEWPLQMVIELVQKGDEVKGGYTITSKEDDSVLVYDVKGHVRDAYLVATAQPKSRYMIDPATFLFRISNHRGLCLSGATCFIAHKSGETKTYDDICFRRKGE